MCSTSMHSHTARLRQIDHSMPSQWHEKRGMEVWTRISSECLSRTVTHSELHTTRVLLVCLETETNVKQLPLWSTWGSSWDEALDKWSYDKTCFSQRTPPAQACEAQEDDPPWEQAGGVCSLQQWQQCRGHQGWRGLHVRQGHLPLWSCFWWVAVILMAGVLHAFTFQSVTLSLLLLFSSCPEIFWCLLRTRQRSKSCGGDPATACWRRLVDKWRPPSPYSMLKKTRRQVEAPHPLQHAEEDS